MRPRSKANKALPPNLYRNGKYFQYKHPQTGKFHGMGSDRAAAIQAANHLNAELILPISLVERVLAPKLTFSKWVDTYRELLQRRNFSPTTERQRTWQIDTLVAALGSKPLAQITTRDIAQFLDARPPRMSNVFRALLNDCFNEAIAKGHLTVNPVAVTKNAKVAVQRQRLELNEFLAIRAEIEPVMQSTLDLALITLQRREDLIALKWSETANGVVMVTQHKTGTRIRIHITPSLARVLENCRSKFDTEWVLHRRETTGRYEAGDPLHTDFVTRRFQTTRDRLDLYPNLKPAERPTFHEVRSLGARLYEEAGMDPQALLGHKNAKMTKVYLDTRRNEWIEASPTVDFSHHFHTILEISP